MLYWANEANRACWANEADRTNRVNKAGNTNQPYLWVFRYLVWWVLPRDFRTLTKWHTEARRELRINKYKAMTGTETPSGHGAKEGVCELYPRRSLNSVCFPELSASCTLRLCRSFCSIGISEFSISLCTLSWVGLVYYSIFRKNLIYLG